MDRMKGFADQVGDTTRSAASQVTRVSAVAVEQAARATALAAESARRRMPGHEPGEPVRDAVLDTAVPAGRIAPGEDGDLQAVALLSAQFLLADFVAS
ncbi:MAG: hypothetical protein IH850_06920, partial [Acidobacteria bacterium]|nr:hypothetical protein [Acidobacteriota bacterium]